MMSPGVGLIIVGVLVSLSAGIYCLCNIGSTVSGDGSFDGAFRRHLGGIMVGAAGGATAIVGIALTVAQFLNR